MQAEAIGITAALTSALAWAVGVILLKQIKDEVSALGLTLAVGLLGLLLLGPFVLATGYQTMEGGDFLILGLSGLLGFAVGDALFFAALGDLEAHLVVLLGVLGQAFTVLLAVLFLGEQVTGLQWVGILMMAGGVVASVEGSEPSKPGRRRARGVLFGLLSVVAVSVSVVIAKVQLDAIPALQGTFVRMLWGTCGLFILGLSGGHLKRWAAPFGSPAVLGRVSVAAVVATFGGFWLFHVALKNIDVAVANPLASTEPLFVLPLAAVFLGEKVGWRGLFGTLIAVAGGMVLCL